jgi:hypothetical protein
MGTLKDKSHGGIWQDSEVNSLVSCWDFDWCTNLEGEQAIGLELFNYFGK